MNTKARDKDWQAVAIFHFVLSCSKLERSLAFYELLGFEIYKDNRDIVWPDYVGENFGMENAQGRAVQLHLPAPHSDAVEYTTRIDLIEWLNPDWINPAELFPHAKRIPQIFALRTRNIAAAVAALKAKGLTPIQPLREPDPVTRVKGVACFADPDGHVVELIEYFDGQLGSHTGELETR